jgi:Anaphase-promoting complex, cyclosome, subunit 4
VLVGRSSTSANLYLNFFENRTLRLHGKTLRQLTASSTDITALLTYLEVTWTSITEEWQEVEKVKSDAVQKLSQYLNLEPEDKPSWWNEDFKTDVEGALLCLLMTGVSEPGVVKWFTERFISVVCVEIYLSDRSKTPKNGRREYLMVTMF